MGFSLVAHVTAVRGDGADVTTDAVDTTGVDLLVVGFASYASTTPTITDSYGNTWTRLTVQRCTADDPCLSLHYAWNPTVGAGHTFTTHSAGYLTVCVLGFSGAKVTADPFDAENGAVTVGTALAPGSCTASEADLFVALLASKTDAALATIDGGFTLGPDTQAWTANHYGMALAYLESASSQNPTWSSNSGSANLGAAIASFKPAAAAPAGQPTAKRFAGVPHMGAGGLKGNLGGSGGAYGRAHRKEAA